MKFDWCARANKSPNLTGKRLSEIGQAVLSGKLTPEDTQIAAEALACGWLDILHGRRNDYGQQDINAA